MLGIGMQEMMIIAVAALLIFGPGKLPEVMGQAGKMYRDFRNMTSELQGEFQKTVAEAQEMGNQITGDLGPMQKQLNSVTKSVERDLGGKGKKTTTSSSRASTGSKSKSSSSSTKRSSTTSRSSKSTSSKSTSSSRTSSSKSSGSKTTSAKKPVAPVATKEDPYSDVSMFVPEAPKRERRARRATPSIISDPTPRELDVAGDEAVEAGGTTPIVSPVDDALARARQRRRNAGYARPSA